ncbi:hypothetical protein PG999_003655 [Apiospora kogelbergensis]|uniref:Ecp2 effector protein-like domain-containing protein n=1 Tax=Apiospora kogelbergensis TaxID=1337665 RepID=A0AAW0R4C1_9PEZI
MHLLPPPTPDFYPGKLVTATPDYTPCCGAQAAFQPTYTAQYYCGSSVVVNNTLGNSPLLSDCQALLANVTGSPGYWTLSNWPANNVMSPVLTNGTCQLTIGKMGNDVGQNATPPSKPLNQRIR